MGSGNRLITHGNSGVGSRNGEGVIGRGQKLIFTDSWKCHRLQRHYSLWRFRILETVICFGPIISKPYYTVPTM